jgi:Methylase involved in ubiquinone/menaquinone biosynthesis
MKADPQEPPRMIEAAGTTDEIRRAYDLWSTVYAKIAGPLEHGPRLRALELAGILPEDTILEVGVGAGAIFLEILRRVGQPNRITGIDLSLKMLHKTRQLTQDRGNCNVGLYQADARQLPFRSCKFNVIYSSYVLDLMQLRDIPQVLREFRRVLKSGGRLVLVNLSREQTDKISWMERLYSWLPRTWVPYLLGSCRPVFMEAFLRSEGFVEVQRELMHHLTRSEIVTAQKPDPCS